MKSTQSPYSKSSSKVRQDILRILTDQVYLEKELELLKSELARV